MSWDVQRDDESDEIHANEPSFGREGIIFLIDCRSEMFNKELRYVNSNEDKEEFYSPFVLGLQCCREFMLSKIRNSNKAMISIMFFGIKNDESSRKYSYQFQPLSVSSGGKIKSIDAIVTSETHNDFTKKYGESMAEAFFADALSACMSSFNQCSVKLSSKRIILFTSDDNPDGISFDRQHQIRKRANDLFEGGVDLELVPIGSEFNAQTFYQEIIETVKSHSYVIMRPVNRDADLGEILDTLDKENFKKRTIGRVQFFVSNKVSFGVGLYKFTCKIRYLKSEYLSCETNEPVVTVQRYVDSTTGGSLRSYELKKTTTIKSREVEFSLDELSKLGKVFRPEISLLGFKSKDHWKIEFHCSSPYFMFPDESLVKGSNKLFKALQVCCLRRNMVAICSMITRVNSCPQFVCLVPQNEVIDEETGQLITPAGFLVHNLPLARMLGNSPVNVTNPVVDDEKIQLMTQIVKKIKAKRYVPDFFENPSLAKLWINIEALALQQTSSRSFTDTTVILMDRLKKRLENLSTEYNTLFAFHGTKRKLESTAAKNGSKKPRLLDLIQENTVHKLTVSELTKVLKCVPNVNLKNAKKADLVELVYSNSEIIKKLNIDVS